MCTWKCEVTLFTLTLATENRSSIQLKHKPLIHTTVNLSYILLKPLTYTNILTYTLRYLPNTLRYTHTYRIEMHSPVVLYNIFHASIFFFSLLMIICYDLDGLIYSRRLNKSMKRKVIPGSDWVRFFLPLRGITLHNSKTLIQITCKLSGFRVGASIWITMATEENFAFTYILNVIYIHWLRITNWNAHLSLETLSKSMSMLKLSW